MYPPYVQKIADELREKTEELDKLKSIISDLRVYLTSEKFYNDTTVQVSDVLHRLAGN